LSLLVYTGNDFRSQDSGYIFTIQELLLGYLTLSINNTSQNNEQPKKNRDDIPIHNPDTTQDAQKCNRKPDVYNAPKTPPRGEL